MTSPKVSQACLNAWNLVKHAWMLGKALMHGYPRLMRDGWQVWDLDSEDECATTRVYTIYI